MCEAMRARTYYRIGVNSAVASLIDGDQRIKWGQRIGRVWCFGNKRDVESTAHLTEAFRSLLGENTRYTRIALGRSSLDAFLTFSMILYGPLARFDSLLRC